MIDIKEVTKAEFQWLYKNHFKKMKKCWYKTCKAKGKSKRGKYYVEDRWADKVRKENIV